MADQVVETGVIKDAQNDNWVKGVPVTSWEFLLVATTPLNENTEMGDFN